MYSKLSQNANHSKAVENNLNATLLKDVREKYRDQKSDPIERKGMSGSRVTSD